MPNLPSTVLVVLSLALPFVAGHAQAQANEPLRSTETNAATLAPSAPKASATRLYRANEGSLGLEILGAVAGDVLAIGLTSLVVLDDVCFGDCDSDHENKVARMGATMQLARPPLVGAATFVFGKLSGGAGRGYAAVLGAVPGAAFIASSYFMPGEGVAMATFFVGHALTIAGTVAAYRYSARKQVEPAEDTLARSITPSAYADRHGGGLTLRASF